MSDVYVMGIDMIRFGRFPEKTVPQLGADAALLALDDAGLRIQDMEAMQQRGVDENKVDEILADYETQLMEFTDAAEATEESLAITSKLVEQEDQELAAIEAELSGAAARQEDASKASETKRDALKAKREAELDSLEADIKRDSALEAPERESTPPTPTAEPEA